MTVNINCDENKIVDAILMLSKIKVDKDKLCTMEAQELNDLAINIIATTCKSIMDALRDDVKGPHVIAEFISHSNLKYLSRALN